MRKLVLKYNPRIGKDKLLVVEDLVKKYGLKIESVEEENRTRILVKVISISGNSDQLTKMDAELNRHASISRKQIF